MNPASDDIGGATLASLIGAECARRVDPVLTDFVRRLVAELGDEVAAVLYYGSCRRSGRIDDGLIDLYVLVDSYRAFYRNPVLMLANRLLPPNVFYRAESGSAVALRAKYAVLSMADFRSGVTNRWLPTLWGRFAQPCSLVFRRDADVERAVVAALADAVTTFLRAAAPLAPDGASAADLWRVGLEASYAVELRPESPVATGARLVAADAVHYARLTRAAAGAAGLHLEQPDSGQEPRYSVPDRARRRRRTRALWRFRRTLGKTLNLLRLVKALFTFDGGVDYALWKVERHAGIRLEPTPFMRRFPRLGVWVAAWRVYRLGGFR